MRYGGRLDTSRNMGRKHRNSAVHGYVCLLLACRYYRFFVGKGVCVAVLPGGVLPGRLAGLLSSLPLRLVSGQGLQGQCVTVKHLHAFTHASSSLSIYALPSRLLVLP